MAAKTEAGKRYEAKQRAIHTDDWYREVGNHQTLTCYLCGKAGNAEELFGRSRTRRNGFLDRCRECRDSASYKRKYGITVQDKRNAVMKAGGVCEICKEKADRYHVDHCHDRGHVRGILCFHCNAALGLFKDSPLILSNAIDYLIQRRESGQ